MTNNQHKFEMSTVDHKYKSLIKERNYEYQLLLLIMSSTNLGQLFGTFSFH